MVFTLLGIIIEVRLSQNLKTVDPIEVRLLGMTTDFRPLLQKAPSPMDVMQLGKVIEVMQLQPPKASFPMLEIPLWIITEVRLLHS